MKHFALAVLALGIGTGSLFVELLRSNLATRAPLGPNDGAWTYLAMLDQRYAIWVTWRNARAMLTPLSRYFESGQCFPAPHALALGHGAMTMGLWALPALAFTRDPVVVFDVAVVTLCFVSALAMWLLVRDWTGDHVAGIVAAALYAFHVVKTGDPEHAFLTDTAWFVLYLLFLRRFLEAPRVGNAVGIVFAGIGQVAAGVYPSVGAMFAGAIVSAGLLRDMRPSRRQWAVLAVLAAAMAAGAFLLMRPYLHELGSHVLQERGRLFMSMHSLLPGGRFFMGVPALLLAAVALFRSPDAPRHVPRLSLLVAALVVTFLAVGGVVTPANADVVTRPSAVYDVVAGWIPGLNTGRGPAYAYGAAHVCFCILAGIGFASLSRLAKERWRSRPYIQVVPVFVAALILVSASATFPRLTLVDPRPAETEIALFGAVDRAGNAGPILELPLDDGMHAADRASRSLLLAAYHRRATSACFASFVTTSLTPELRDAIGRLPFGDSLDAIEHAGFRALWVRREGDGKRLAHRLTRLAADAAADVPDAPHASRVSFLGETDDSVVFALRPPEPSVR